MLKFISLKIRVQALESTNMDKVLEFGRDLQFQDGLNFVIGENTSGKTTLAKCMCYAIGMEQLYDPRLDVSTLGEAVTASFVAKNSEMNDKTYIVKTSYVITQIKNDKNKFLEIKRNIKTDGDKNILYVKKGDSIEDFASNVVYREYFIHSRDDHSSKYDNGFYAMLADFAGLPLTTVVGSNALEETPLYMQTIFASSFIEQTKGWSDYFASIRSFNISNPKQKMIEYIMNYQSNDEIQRRKNVRQEKKDCLAYWNEAKCHLDALLSYNDMMLEMPQGLFVNLTKDIPVYIRDTGMSFATTKNSLISRKEELTAKLKQEKSLLNNSQDYIKLKDNLDNANRAYETAIAKLREDEIKLNIVSKRINDITEEQKRYASYDKVRNVVRLLDVQVCPQCHRPLPLNDSSSDNTQLNSKTIEEYRQQLRMNLDFLQHISDALTQTLESERTYVWYLESANNEARESLKTYLQHSNLSASLSNAEQIELSTIAIRLSKMDVLEQQVRTQLTKMNELATRIDELASQKVINEEGTASERTPIAGFLNDFRTRLNKYNYSSYSILLVNLSEKQNSSYCYFPLIDIQGYDEPLRVVSSASDFIRSEWAYYMTLLFNGQHHPGFLIMDEPCQHSMKPASLQALFKDADQLEKQVILFCSNQPDVGENKDISEGDYLLHLIEDCHLRHAHLQILEDKAIVLLPD